MSPSGSLTFAGQCTMSLRLVTPPTMPSADFSRRFPPPRGDGCPRHGARSPRVRHTTFTLMPAAFTPMPSGQVLDFDVTCHLIRHPCLVCGFCSSGQRFATGFVAIRCAHCCLRRQPVSLRSAQTPPHDDAVDASLRIRRIRLCPSDGGLSLAFPPDGYARDFPPAAPVRKHCGQVTR